MARAPRLLTDNWQLKLAALGLSIFLWALVQTEPLSQETFSAVPVSVAVEDTTWTLSGAPSPSTVELRLGGPAREIIRLARDGTSLRIPVSVVGSRDTAVTVQREWVQLGRRAGVTVESVSPAVISLHFEPAVAKTVPLVLRTTGGLSEELALSSALVLSPESVTVRGPESAVSRLAALPVEPFDLEQVEESGVFPLRVDTTGLAGAHVDPGEAVVGVRVEPLEERVLSGVRVQADLAPGAPELTVEPRSIQLRLTGARTLVTSMDLSLLRVTLAPESLHDLVPGEIRRVRLQIEGLPPLIRALPSTETVIVRPAADEADRT
jgi:YbbR domain-containing protein